MQKILINTITYIIVFVGLTMFSPHVRAQQSREVLSISPFIFNLRLSPGEKYERTMTVKNLLDVPLPIKLTVEDFLVQDEDGGYDFSKNNTSSVRPWITLEETNYILEPKERQEIKMTMQIPQKIPFGGYQGIIFVQPVLPGQQQYSTLLNAKVGALVLANIGSQAYQIHPARILTFDMPLVTFSKDEIPIMFRVQNNSLYHFSAKPRLSFDPLLGSVKTYSVLEQFLFPGKIRRWNETLDLKDLKPGIYATKLLISVGNGVQISSTKYIAYIPRLYAIALMLFLFVVIGIFFITKKPKHIAQFIRILIKGR